MTGRSLPAAVRRGTHVLAALDPGPRGRQHGAALRGRRRHGRLVPAPADPRRPARAAGRRGGGRGEQRDRARPRTRLAAAPGTDIDASAQQRDLVEPIIQRGDTRGLQRRSLSGPVGSGGRIADGGNEVHRRPGHCERPGLAGGALRRAGRHRLDLHRDRGPSGEDGRAGTHRARRSSWARRSGCRPTVETYTLYYLFPLDERAGDAGAGPAGAAHRRRCCCSCWSPG